jgi:hypothetical protein
MLSLAFVIATAALVGWALQHGKRASASDTPAGTAQLQRVARRSTTSRTLGLLGGAVIALSVFSTREDLGLEITFAAPAFAGCALIGVLAGELLNVPPATRARTAVLEVRTAWDYLPRVLTRWVLGLTALLAGVLTSTSLAADPDILGRRGRTITMTCGNIMTIGAGPWPGSYYSLPIAATVLAGAILAGVVLRTVSRRPRPVAEDSARAVDDGLRRSAARATTAAFGLVVSTPLAAVTLLSGAQLLRVSCTPVSWTTGAGIASFAVSALAFVASCVFVAATGPGR